MTSCHGLQPKIISVVPRSQLKRSTFTIGSTEPLLLGQDPKGCKQTNDTQEFLVQTPFKKTGPMERQFVGEPVGKLTKSLKAPINKQ